MDYHLIMERAPLIYPTPKMLPHEFPMAHVSDMIVILDKGYVCYR